LKLPSIDLLWLVALTILALLRPVRQWIRGLPALGWPTVQGTVGAATVSAQHGIIPTYLVRFPYTYVVNGEYYSGFYEKTFLRKNSAELFASALKGQMAFVRYQQSLPQQSTVLPRDQYGWPA